MCKVLHLCLNKIAFKVRFTIIDTVSYLEYIIDTVSYVARGKIIIHKHS